jgi:serine/threonine-protein kinase
MAPEQIQGVVVTRRTDVYAASVVLWEALTGERLFKGDNEANVLARVLNEAVPPPSSVVPLLPASLDRIVLKGLQREPGERYATAREMAQELDGAFGVASAAEIGDWVERVAAQELEDRAKRIADIERRASDQASDDDMETSVRVPASPGVEAPDAPTPVGRRELEEATGRKPTPAEPPSQVSSVSVAQPTAPPAAPTGPARGTWIAVASGATALVLLVAVIIAVTRSGTSAGVAASPTLTDESPSAALPPPSPPPLASEASSAETTATAPIPTPTPTPTPTPPLALPATGPHPPPVRTARPADCNPPYTTDAKGHVHFKPQCM